MATDALGNVDSVFTLGVDFNDENTAPSVTTGNVTATAATKTPLERDTAAVTATAGAEDVDVDALLAGMQSDINDAGNDSVGAAETVETSDADVLSQFKSMMAADVVTAEVTAEGATTATESVAAPAAAARVVMDTTGAIVATPTTGATTSPAPATTAEAEPMSIADRCAALLSSVSLDNSANTAAGSSSTNSTSSTGSGSAAAADALSGATLSSTVESGTAGDDSGSDEYMTDMSDQVAKFALEAMNEDEPKYTEKEMDVLHKKAKMEAAAAFEDQRQALLAQMTMMEAKMGELAAEKEAMKAEMAEVNELVKGFEGMADSVAKKKDDEIYQLFEAKKKVEHERKELAAQCEALELEVRTAGELKAMVALEHAEELNTVKDAHNVALNEVRTQLNAAEQAAGQTRTELAAAQKKLAHAEKQRDQFDAANRKLQASLEEANTNCTKYKQIGAKTRDQAQAQLDKAKQLVIATKQECANLKHTVASLEDTCKTNVSQLETEQTARTSAEEENKTLKAQVQKQQEEMKQLTLEAYRCTKAEQELEQQKKSNKELYEMCNELMKQVEANKAK